MAMPILEPRTGFDAFSFISGVHHDHRGLPQCDHVHISRRQLPECNHGQPGRRLPQAILCVVVPSAGPGPKCALCGRQPQSESLCPCSVIDAVVQNAALGAWIAFSPRLVLC